MHVAELIPGALILPINIAFGKKESNPPPSVQNSTIPIIGIDYLSNHAFSAKSFAGKKKK